MSHDDLVLEAADGSRFAAFLAAPEEPARVGVVILPDVRGLYRFYEELALRFAERGYASLAFDYFGRTAGVEKRDDDFEYMLIAALSAEGTSTIGNIRQIDRGYERIDERLRELGAAIERTEL